MRLLSWMFFSTLLLCGCPSKFSLVKNADDISRYMDKIKTHNQQVEQVKASLDIKAYGVMAGFLHEQADVVVRSPHYFYLSLRSFFTSPNLIVASNGQFLTMLDFTGASENTYESIPLSADTFFSVMDFRLHPASLISLLLGKITLETGQNFRLTRSDDRLRLCADTPGGWQACSVFDYAKERLLETEFLNDTLNISYHARYVNHRLISGIYFPTWIVLVAKGNSRVAKLNIELSQIQINGELVLPDVFYVKPH